MPGPSALTFQLTRGSTHITFTTVASGNQLLPASTRRLQETSEVLKRLQPLTPAAPENYGRSNSLRCTVFTLRLQQHTMQYISQVRNPLVSIESELEATTPEN